MQQKKKIYTDPYEAKLFSNIFTTLFPEKSVSVCFDLNFCGIPMQFRRDQATYIANKFRNNISRRYFGQQARRNKKLANIAAFLHLDPDPHIHIIVELPEKFDLEVVKEFCSSFVLKNYPFCIPQRRNEQICYCEETRAIEGAAFYNLRFGTDNCILF